MKEDNQDLLDLCRLNLLEENVNKTTAIDTEEVLLAIEWKKKRLIEKIKLQQGKINENKED